MTVIDGPGQAPTQPGTNGARPSGEQPAWRAATKTAVGRWWVTSILVSLALALVLMLIWVRRDHVDPTADDQLVDAAAVQEALGASVFRGPPETLVRIRTGAFIQSLQFESSNDVHLTGYLWQRFDGDVRPEALAGRPIPAADASGNIVGVTPGFILPEQVDSSFDIVRRSVVFNGPPRDDTPVPPTPPGHDTTTTTTTSTTSTTSTTTPSTTVPPSTSTTIEIDGEKELGPLLFRSPRPPRSSGVAEGTTTILYYFEAPVRQPFTYTDYPFDDKVVWLRIWPADFENNVVLVPDFDGYPCQDPPQPTRPCTGAKDEFGVDTSIVLGDFKRANTYFDYEKIDYNSNFGNDRFKQQGYPELRYNVLIRRNLANAFIGNLVPLIVAAGLAFGILMTITGNDRIARRFGFSTTQVMTTLAGLFLAVLIAQQQIRGRFAGVVYFEYFYFLVYLVLLGVGVVAILASVPRVRDSWLFTFAGEDNLLLRVLYWPTLMLACVVITVFTLW